ncbi:hypothetical protein [Aureibacillus halotolerans]|uniref:Uncharacterized protein n=1 Tax=Aureibacillus halotolerans TaxID=1508390 RepID=A0A4R6UAV5_9BACI|nr:hypothetical protein [Aureibacillus halotolerans]TDQ43032.1 hypothetical protein EV213_101464 [Aureibacillus halotolerans]
MKRILSNERGSVTVLLMGSLMIMIAGFMVVMSLFNEFIKQGHASGIAQQAAFAARK